MSGGWGTPTWMGGIPDTGETYVHGQDTQTARDLLEAADRLGVERQTVRAVRGGFVVPDPVWETAQQIIAARQGTDPF